MGRGGGGILGFEIYLGPAWLILQLEPVVCSPEPEVRVTCTGQGAVLA